MKKYRVEYSKEALKILRKMDTSTRNRITNWINENLEGCENPRFDGIALKGNLHGNWRYRVGDYRIVAKIEDDKILITIVRLGHRGDIYKKS
jgi:mRNA interferase RelE/StbE